VLGGGAEGAEALQAAHQARQAAGHAPAGGSTACKGHWAAAAATAAWALRAQACGREASKRMFVCVWEEGGGGQPCMDLRGIGRGLKGLDLGAGVS